MDDCHRKQSWQHTARHQCGIAIIVHMTTKILVLALFVPILAAFPVEIRLNPRIFPAGHPDNYLNVAMRVAYPGISTHYVDFNVGSSRLVRYFTEDSPNWPVRAAITEGNTEHVRWVPVTDPPADDFTVISFSITRCYANDTRYQVTVAQRDERDENGAPVTGLDAENITLAHGVLHASTTFGDSPTTDIDCSGGSATVEVPDDVSSVVVGCRIEDGFTSLPSLRMDNNVATNVGENEYCIYHGSIDSETINTTSWDADSSYTLNCMLDYNTLFLAADGIETDTVPISTTCAITLQRLLVLTTTHQSVTVSASTAGIKTSYLIMCIIAGVLILFIVILVTNLLIKRATKRRNTPSAEETALEDTKA